MVEFDTILKEEPFCYTLHVPKIIISSISCALLLKWVYLTNETWKIEKRRFLALRSRKTGVLLKEQWVYIPGVEMNYNT